MIRRLPDGDAIAAAAAAEFHAAATAAVASRGRFRVALSGGTSPVALYRLLAGPPWRRAVPWSRTEILFADERGVAPGHPDSNYGLLRHTLLDFLRGDGPRVRRMAGEGRDLDAAALDYERWLDSPLDLAVLGVGADGHTASIFPGSSAACECDRRVIAVLDAPKPPPRRLTLTPRALDEARALMVLATGPDKAAAVAAALEGTAPLLRVPARLARRGEWLVDAAAARSLAGRA